MSFFLYLCDYLIRLVIYHFAKHKSLIIMYLPNWMQKYKERRREIKRVKNGYYKYEVAFVYNKEKKKTEKNNHLSSVSSAC